MKPPNASLVLHELFLALDGILYALPLFVLFPSGMTVQSEVLKIQIILHYNLAIWSEMQSNLT